MNYKEMNSAVKKINNWYSKKTRVLNIKTRPNNTALVFSSIINKVINNNGTVLYVWCTSTVSNLSKKERDYYSLLVENAEKNSRFNNIKFIFIDKILDVNYDCDLVIFDDITVFSNTTVESLREAVEDIYWKSKKIIIYSCEKIFPIGEKMDLVYLLSTNPIIEPRFITTRIKMEEDIPLALFEYLKWFHENRKVTLIITPSEDKLNKVYNSYYNILREENIRLVKYSKGQKFSFIKNILDESVEGVFIVTNNIGGYINTIENLNIVMLFADDPFYNYKKILYLCGTLKKTSDILPEAILVSKDVSGCMDKAKSLTRGFNQKLWEKKLLRV